MKGDFDLVIAASGYEERCTHIASMFTNDMTRKAIGFRENRDNEQRLKNDAVFSDLGFEFYKNLVSEGNRYEVIAAMDSILAGLPFHDSIRILVDYSCMTRVWLSAFVNYFKFRNTQYREVYIYFMYSPSEYTRPSGPRPNSYMGPIPGVFRIASESKPTALIMGLGYEESKAKGLVDFIEPEMAFAFYSKPAIYEKFVKDVEINNEEILHRLRSEADVRVFTYPLHDLREMESKLMSIYFRLNQDYKVVLAPLGPKPFSLICLLVAEKFEDIDVWRVSSGIGGNIYSRRAADVDPIVCEVKYSR